MADILTNFVKFLRGTPTAYKNLTEKDADTLYFISEKDAKNGQLYLGEILISASVNENEVIDYLSELKDVDTSGAMQNSILGFDKESNKWIAMDIANLITISVMTGADSETDGTEGLVPAPKAGMEKLFLRADGTWAAPTGDNLSIEVIDSKIQLKNFNNGYYSYVEPIKDLETGEILIPSSFEHREGFIEGLIPKSIRNEITGNLELAWFEQSPEDIDELKSKIDIISKSVDGIDEALNSENGLVNKIDNLQSQVGSSTERTGIYQEIDHKANSTDVYLKEETYSQKEIETIVSKAVSEANHLKRKIVEEYIDIEIYVNTYNDADQYIFMVPSGQEDQSNKYYEYIVLFDESRENYSIEKIGDWEVDLSDYVKTETFEQELNKKVSKKSSVIIGEDGQETEVEWTLLSPEDQEKLNSLVIGEGGDIEISGTINADNIKGLGTWITRNKNIVDGLFSEVQSNKLDSIEQGAQVNFITNVSNEFTVNENKTLGLNSISISKVGNLQNELNNINTEISSLKSVIADDLATKIELNAAVGDLNQIIAENNKLITSQIDDINDRLMWQPLSV